MRRTERQFIVDILEMMANARRFVEGLTLEELEQDLKTQLAIQSCFVVIGEAANKVDPELRTRHPGVPWREMISMRNLVVHGYWSISMEIMLDTIPRDFPAAQSVLKQVLHSLPPEEDTEGDGRTEW